MINKELVAPNSFDGSYSFWPADLVMDEESHLIYKPLRKSWKHLSVWGGALLGLIKDGLSHSWELFAQLFEFWMLNFWYCVRIFWIRFFVKKREISLLVEVCQLWLVVSQYYLGLKISSRCFVKNAKGGVCNDMFFFKPIHVFRGNIAQIDWRYILVLRGELCLVFLHLLSEMHLFQDLCHSDRLISTGFGVKVWFHMDHVVINCKLISWHIWQNTDMKHNWRLLNKEGK
jgi:hypothetical protein